MQARCDQDSDSGGCPLCLALCHLGGCSRVCLAFLDVKVRATIPSRIEKGGKATRGSTKSKELKRELCVKEGIGNREVEPLVCCGWVFSFLRSTLWESSFTRTRCGSSGDWDKMDDRGGVLVDKRERERS